MKRYDPSQLKKILQREAKVNRAKNQLDSHSTVLIVTLTIFIVLFVIFVCWFIQIHYGAGFVSTFYNH